jgi:hypothetical protein
MPQRQNNIKLKSDEVQGEGSYVIVKRPTVADVKQWQREARELTKERKRKEKELKNNPELEEELEEGDIVIEMSSERLAKHVVSWNWVDDDGNPLPNPHGNVEIFDILTDDEFTFLGTCLLGSAENRKNLKTA